MSPAAVGLEDPEYIAISFNIFLQNWLVTKNSIDSSYTFVFIYVLSDFLATGKNDMHTHGECYFCSLSAGYQKL